ncbi:MAG: rhomboid family intramembrane serine protease [Bacteroidetes bacterium]|nr:MAG: rhomboid family intramembrane serine protease [Bacteroidota bacterium]
METENPQPKLLLAIIFPLLFTALLWLIEGIETLNNFDFSHFGIYPRNFEGLKGILLMPFVHAELEHITNNSMPLFLLLSSIFYFYRPVAWKIWLWTWLMAGFWVWVAARPAWHIGASGLIYGFGSFIFFSGIIRRNIKLLALSLMVVFLYGGMVWGILPIEEHISWEGHLFGAIAGLILSIHYRKQGPQREKYSWELEEEEEEINDARTTTINYIYLPKEEKGSEEDNK